MITCCTILHHIIVQSYTACPSLLALAADSDFTRSWILQKSHLRSPILDVGRKRQTWQISDDWAVVQALHFSDLIKKWTRYYCLQIWSNIFLSMASIVIWMQVRFLFIEIQKRVARHRNYLKVVRSMEARFSVASEEDIRLYDDNCAICWDRMQVARKLPCGHLFHKLVYYMY